MSRRPKGLRIKTAREGLGRVAAKGDIVLVHYECFLPRGEKVFSSRDRPHPAQFRLGKRNAFAALEYGVPGMAVGGIRIISASPQLTYAERKVIPGLPDGAALRYEVELLRISDEWDNSIYGKEWPAV